MGAFTPLMENGGDNQHRPWMFDNTNQTVDIYRAFVHIHTEVRGRPGLSLGPRCLTGEGGGRSPRSCFPIS